MAMVNRPNGRDAKQGASRILKGVMRCRRLCYSKRGQAIVETALIFPLLCLLVLGSADLGRVFYYSMEVTNASREGARFGSAYDPANGNAAATHAAVIAAAKREASDLNLVEPSPAFAPANCQSGPPYAAAYYPTAANTGYIFACFSVSGVENDSATSGTAGETVRVTILYNFTPMTPMAENIGSGTIHVQATTTMVIQGQP
jgi:Flp pilus assembly protein TadG